MKENQRLLLWASTSVAFLGLTAELEFYFHSRPARVDPLVAGSRWKSYSETTSAAAPSTADPLVSDTDSTFQDALNDAAPVEPKDFARPKRLAPARWFGRGRREYSGGEPDDFESDDLRSRPRILNPAQRKRSSPAVHPPSTAAAGAAVEAAVRPRRSVFSAGAAASREPSVPPRPSLRRGPHEPRFHNWVEALGGKSSGSRMDRVRRLMREPDWDGSARESSAGAKAQARKHNDRSRRPHSPRRPRAEWTRPPALKRLLGGGVLRPPLLNIHPPDMANMLKSDSVPVTPPDGAPFMSSSDLASVKPPAEEPHFIEWERQDARNTGPQWHEGAGRYWHRRKIWGIERNGRWCWTARENGRWWAWVPGAPPLLWHRNHWWRQAKGAWFLLHEGQTWSYRNFPDWNLDGLVHPESGARIVYGADSSKAAILAPGDGVTLLDVDTGGVLDRWKLDEEDSNGD